MTVPGFNVRKANNRQGPGLFDLAAGKLTVVLADQAVAPPPMAKSPAVAPAVAGATSPVVQQATKAKRVLPSVPLSDR